ncbi:AAA family ATPase [Streptomyces sp. URMC 126]|uniref:AAA family ATPase n=1 Tax=Streptomyces sp. URMC 126 TaxID=3423401 RepID=UPI003F1C054C
MQAITTAMVGRDGEQAELREFVKSGTGRALVVRGEAGAGRTTLVHHAAALAEREGHLVIRAAGTEAESGLPYAGLHQFLHPLLPDVARLDDGARAALDAVFGGGRGEPPSVMELGIAVLGLLALSSARRPLSLVLDDGQWLDDVSADVCGFVGRRLAGGPVKLLVAVRADISSRFDTAALPELPVAALPDEDAARLLDARHPELDPELRRAVLAKARGNPLALLELAAHRAGRSGGLPAEDPVGPHDVPLSPRSRRLFGSRVEALDERVRNELLMGALDGAGDPGGTDAGSGTRYVMRDADAAVTAGLLEVEAATGELVFRHPLVRPTVVRLATPSRLRAAHRALARFHRVRPERRAAHLAAAAVGPDEGVAGALEAAARCATRRGGAPAAVTWLTRAAELSESDTERSRRLADAAFVACHAASSDQAHRILRADPAAGALGSPASVLAAGYQALYLDGDVRSTHRQVSAAIARLRDGGPAGSEEVLDRLVVLLLAISQYSGDRAGWESTHQLLASMGGLVTERARLYSGTWSDVTRHGADWAEPVRRAAADLPDLEPWEAARLGVAAYHLDLLDGYRAHLRRVTDRELETGAVATGLVMLHQITLDRMAAGEWAEAENAGQRGLDLAVAHGHHLFAAQSRAYLAQLAALRGRIERARELRAEVDAWARPRGLGFLIQVADAAGATAALSAGDYEAAYRYAAGITRPGTFRPYAHQAPRTLLDLVEAALHTGRAEEARAHAAAAHDAGLPGVSPRLGLITHGALAVTAEDEREAAEMFARAESHPDAARFPFELARVRFAYGMSVCRARGHAAARQYLAPAAEAFERLGAVGWAERAHAAARAIGAPPRAVPEGAGGPPRAGARAARTPSGAGSTVARTPSGAGSTAARTPSRSGSTAARTPSKAGSLAARTPSRAVPHAATTPPRAANRNPDSLTWQERRIADLAASGLTNKEIGERMHLSPRTVSSHLYRAFPKLGITARAALRDALSRVEEGASV